jgi:hypothetical protein
MPFFEGQFEAAFGVLEDRWNRKFSTPTALMYRSLLEEELTSEQFAQACRAAFKYEAFFPTPARLIELGKGSTPESEARALWDVALTAVRAGERSSLTDEQRALLLSSCHGRSPADLDVKTLEFSKREFVLRYSGFLRGEKLAPLKALPAPAKELTDAAD